MLRMTLALPAVVLLGIACGTETSPLPVATAEPEPAVTPAPTVAPLPTPRRQPSLRLRRQRPFSNSLLRVPPLPTPTPIPRAEGDMTQAVLYNHTATLLEDGRVLVIGGQTSRRSSQFSLPPAVASAEIYDPSTGRWSPTRPMFDPRRHHGGVLLEDGMVLVSGGLTEEFTTHVENAEVDYVFPIASAEVYDPSTETWSRVSDMPEETVDFVGTQNNLPAILLDMLENGKVLAAGGLGPSAALYNASSGTWDSAGEVTSDDYRTRDWHTSALLGDGKVLYIGGWTGSAAMDSVDLYNPLTGSVSSTGSMSWPRRFPSAAVLADGWVLVTGGGGIVGGSLRVLRSAEIYDPQSGTWSEAEEMTAERIFHTMTMLPDGRVLVVEGPNGWTEIYDPSTGIWSRAASMIKDRRDHTATVLKPESTEGHRWTA